MSSRRSHAKKARRICIAAALCLGLVAGNFILAAQWSEPAYAKNGNAGGNGGGNGGGAGNAGGNGGGHGNAGGKGGGANAPAADPDTALSLRNAGRIKPLSEVYAAAERQFDGEVIDARLVGDQIAGWAYEVRVVGEDGRLHDVTYGATNLAVVSVDGEPVE